MSSVKWPPINPEEDELSYASLRSVLLKLKHTLIGKIPA